MKGTMKAFYAEADWAPQPQYVLSEREKAESRAMRADFVYKNVRASMKDVAIPETGDGDVLIRVGACGVCGSDLSALKSKPDGYSAFASHMKFPVILGHEFSGEVIEVRKKVKSVRVGDIIAVE